MIVTLVTVSFKSGCPSAASERQSHYIERILGWQCVFFQHFNITSLPLVCIISGEKSVIVIVDTALEKSLLRC